MASEIWKLFQLQMVSEVSECSFHVDFYSLGVTLYGIFAGQLPYDDSIHPVPLGSTDFLYDETEWAILPKTKLLVQALLTVIPMLRAGVCGCFLCADGIDDE